MNIPAKFGNIAKVYVSRNNTDELAPGTAQATFTTYTAAVDTLLTNITGLSGDMDALQSAVTTFTETYTAPSPEQITTLIELGAIRIYILSYDKNKNLVGNPVASLISSTDNIPLILKNNISNYIDNFRLLTDTIELLDGFIINFGVFFDVVVHKFANKSEVKLKCIQKIKDYFNINKMQFSQPIYVSQLEYELMGIDGVRAVNYVTITQGEDWNALPPESAQALAPTTFKYSISPGDSFPFTVQGEIVEEGTDGYGWSYDFEAAYENGVILPPSPTTPGIFELKNPNQNIKGVVR